MKSPIFVNLKVRVQLSSKSRGSQAKSVVEATVLRNKPFTIIRLDDDPSWQFVALSGFWTGFLPRLHEKFKQILLFIWKYLESPISIEEDTKKNRETIRIRNQGLF